MHAGKETFELRNQRQRTYTMSTLLYDVASWIWGGNGEDVEVSPEFCVEHLPFRMNSACWSRLLAKVIGLAIIAASCLNRAPIILNLLSTRSAAGLSRLSVYGESIMYANGAFYGMLSKIPFTAYGESCALLVQSSVIALILWQLSVVSIKEKMIVGLAASLYIFTVTSLLPEDRYYILMTSILPVMIYSRGIQILATTRCKHTGAQSILTASMNVGGGILRVFTTIHEVGFDLAFLSSVIISLSLNITILCQIVFYRKNTEKYLAGLKKADSQKKSE